MKEGMIMGLFASVFDLWDKSGYNINTDYLERRDDMCNQNQAIVILGEVYASCNPVFGNTIRDAYLYGSYARGDYHEESDIDILLAVDLEQDAISKFRNSIGMITSELSLKHDITVSVTVKPFEQFRRYADVLPYYKNVLREGIRHAS